MLFEDCGEGNVQARQEWSRERVAGFFGEFRAADVPGDCPLSAEVPVPVSPANALDHFQC